MSGFSPGRTFLPFGRICIIAVILITCWWLLVVDGTVVRNEDICGAHNGRRLYVELGEQGILFAKNVTFLTNSRRQDSTNPYATNSSHDQCSLELVTCPSCVISVTFKTLALSHHCGDGGIVMDSPCRCDYVWISEPPYEDVSGTPFCGLYAPVTYRSATRTLSIALLYSQSHKHAFTLEYTAERNRLLLKGSDMVSGVAKRMNNTSGGILTSPFFPGRYPRDLGMEYIITCPTEATSCRVRVLFSDFQLATVSIIEFYDWNGQRLDVSSGARFRPPVIVSSGPSLLIRFYANGGTGLGYKAFYSFVMGHLSDKTIQPITDCGGYVENLGGAITMMDMVGQGVKTYDCVWLIRPPKNFIHMKTHMYLKVVNFADMAGNTELIIKQGPTSALLPLEVLRHPASQLLPRRLKEHVAPVSSGFHVSLRGTFGPTSRLAIAYAAFSYMDCFTGSDFLCQNHRCIPSQLNCDGFDHCGDNSDEPASCFQDWDDEPQDRKWHMNKANYYFPKIDRYPDLKTATLVFVASSLGLIILISALIILLYRMGARARQQRDLQNRLQTISELLVFDIADGARIDEITVSDDPPVYEAPPGYDEVVKLGLECETTPRRMKRRSSNTCREPRSRSSPSSYEQDSQPSTLLLADEASTSRSSQTTPVPRNNETVDEGECVPRIPESPPPPYVTPPGTFPRNFTALPEVVSNTQSSNCSNGRRGRIPRAFVRSNSECSQSVSTQDFSNTEETPARETSIDAEALGAYLVEYETRRSFRSSNPCHPQPGSSSGASTDTNPNCVGNCGNHELENAGEGDRVLAEASCACEGACGCATDDPQPETSITASKREGGNSENAESTKSTIVRLLGSSRSGSRMSHTTNLNSTTASSCASTPSGTIGRSFRRNRKVSICSRDSYVTRISNLSCSASYEKLQDEVEVVSEATSILATISTSPIETPTPRKLRKKSYSSCDLDSLCESIKALDTFLAQRGEQANLPCSSSVAVMLFGTPEHGREFHCKSGKLKNNNGGSGSNNEDDANGNVEQQQEQHTSLPCICSEAAPPGNDR